jgi:hypothetical protein
MLARAFIYLSSIELARRTRGYPQLLQRASFPESGPRRGTSTVSMHCRRAVAYARWVERAARHTPFSAQCLHRSLALYLWLQHDGIESVVKVGVRKIDDEFKAHAWVELEGTVVNDDARAVASFSLLSRPAGFEALPFVGDSSPLVG